MNDSTARYRKEELQDANGNVVYPHSHASVIWMEDEDFEGSIGEYVSRKATDEDITAALID